MALVGDSLASLVDLSTLECLGEAEAHKAGNAFQQDDSFLQSDTDPELLIKVAFRGPVKLSAIKITGTDDQETYPASVRLFQGKMDLGFDDAKEDACTQEFALEAEQVAKGEALPLRFVKFQSVQNVQVFIGENCGAETTQIKRIEFIGEPASNMDMKDWKPVKG